MNMSSGTVEVEKEEVHNLTQFRLQYNILNATSHMNWWNNLLYMFFWRNKSKYLFALIKKYFGIHAMLENVLKNISFSFPRTKMYCNQRYKFDSIASK